MKMILNKKIVGMMALVAGFAFSCSENETGPQSTIQRFETYNATLSASTPAVVSKDVDAVTVFTYELTFDAAQQYDVTVNVAAGKLSTAEEGVDFEILTHSVDVPALAGQDGFNIEIEILSDFTVGEEDETIYLEFSSELPNGLLREEILVATIEGGCTEPASDMFIGAYTVASTGDDPNVGGGAPVFSEAVTLTADVGLNLRSFDATYLGIFGIGNAPQTWSLQFDGCSGGANTFVWVDADTNLGCTGTIELLAGAVSGTTDLADDTLFTVTLFEGGSDCSSGETPVTLTFTKI